MSQADKATLAPSANFGEDAASQLQDGEQESNSRVSASFRDSKTCIAVDISASTYGTPLEVEKRAIKKICSLLPAQLQSNITILPWSDTSYPAIRLPDINSLFSDGGTDPNVNFEDPESRLCLQQSSFWFLLTDGEIDREYVHEFSRNLTNYGMHGKGAVVIVFGERLARPSQCNITVGVSVFATSPHAACLYTDIETGKTFVLQTKGCFISLLPPRSQNPNLDYDTTWDDLPQISLENLMRVSVPPVQTLGPDEISLQGPNGPQTMNLAALLSGTLPVTEDVLELVMDNEQNRQTVTMTAKSRGKEKEFRSWLDQVDEKLELEGLRQAKSTNTNPESSRLITDTMARLGSPSAAPIASYPAPTYSHQLRPDHLHISSQGIPEEEGLSTLPLRDGYEASSTTRSRRESSGRMRRMSHVSVEFAETNFQRLGGPDRPRKIPVDEWKLLEATGFTKPATSKEHFKGICSVCDRFNQNLVLLLVKSAIATTTLNFPKERSRSRLLFPLAMGNYPETDVVSSIVPCFQCASHFAAGFRTKHGEAVVGMLPLLSFSRNRGAWLAAVDRATSHRFNQIDLPEVFLAILFTKLERSLAEEQVSQMGFKQALDWECNMILTETILQGHNNIPLRPDETTPLEQRYLGSGSLEEVLLRNFRGMILDNEDPFLLQYPLDGFIVANAALSYSRHNGFLSNQKRKEVVMMKFLYHLVVSYHSLRARNGVAELQALQSSLLLVPDPKGPRSLFKINKMREITMFAENIEQMKAYLRRHATAQAQYNVAVSVAEIAAKHLLGKQDLQAFRRLGSLFTWMETQAGHIIAVFLHFLFRLETSEIEMATPQRHFKHLRGCLGVKQALEDPLGLSTRSVQDIVKDLSIIGWGSDKAVEFPLVPGNLTENK